MTEPGNGRSLEVRVGVIEERVRTHGECLDELRATVSGMNSKLTTILVSIATAAILLAINLIVSGFAR